MQTEHYRPNRCTYCGTGISVNQTIQPGHCGDQDCATRHAVKGHYAAQKARRDVYAEHLRSARNAPEMADLVARAGVNSRAEMTLVAVPFNGTRLVPVEEERMADFKTHLSDVIAQAFEASDTEVATYMPDRKAEPEEPFLAAGCATCQGNCCKLGNKSKAFLSRLTMMGHRKIWPDLTAEVMEANYLAALPELASEECCVYQGEMGCTLPREMRSDICNSFHCHELEFGEERAKQNPDRPIAIVAVDDDGVARNFATLTQTGEWQTL